MITYNEDTTGAAQPTIAAVATPFGRGALAMIRVSGGGAFAVADKVFRAKNGKSARDLPGGSAVFGSIYKDGEKIDEGILTVYRAPRSFTGEDSVEVTCHGGVLLTATVLEAFYNAGAEPAQPGEFSKRAFVNGKMSLQKAESVIDLIDAENAHQLRLASKNANGALQRRVDAITEKLTVLLAETYVTIDYPDEDLRDMTSEEFTAKLEDARAQTKKLADSYKTGHAVASGVQTAIVGRPNTGKSSLLNLLLGKERAIVSDIAGTTRDTVEEKTTVGMVTLRLIDTAGLRKTDDPIEKLGVARSRAAMDEAELIFAVFDNGEEASAEDLLLIKELEKSGKPVVAFLNKADRRPRFDRALLDPFETVVFSAKEGDVPEKLEAILEKLYGTGDIASLDEGLLTNARTFANVRAAAELLDGALAAMRAGESPAVAAIDVETALARLKETEGESVGEDIAAAIFSRFCVGK